MTNTIKAKQLFNIVDTTVGTGSGFALLLGAGASRSSGVKTAAEMMNDWAAELHGLYSNGSQSLDDYINTEFPEVDLRYSKMFEKLYPMPANRRDYIEKCLENATPTWGYANLIGLMEAGTIDVVLTTNFDDLIAESCYSFSRKCRPVIVSHDSSAALLRLKSNRPKVIKLHGDYLFDNIKNTVRELESLEGSTRDKFVQIAQEHGLVVIGYNGNDRSIMEPLEQLLRQQQYFRNGVFWCYKSGEEVNQKVKDLCAVSRQFKLVEIDSFDAVMAEMRLHLKLKLPTEIQDPLAATKNRLKNLMENDVNLPKSITDDRDALLRQFELLASDRKPSQDASSTRDMSFELPEADVVGLKLFPYGLLAKRSFDLGEKEKAIDYAKRNYSALKLNSNDDQLLYQSIVDIISYSDPTTIADADLLKDYIDDSGEMLRREPQRYNEMGLELIKAGRLRLARRCFNMGFELLRNGPIQRTSLIYHDLNIMQIDKREKPELSAKQIDRLGRYVNDDSTVVQIAAMILLGKSKEEVESKISELENSQAEHFRTWPIYSLTNSG